MATENFTLRVAPYSQFLVDKVLSGDSSIADFSNFSTSSEVEIITDLTLLLCVTTIVTGNFYKDIDLQQLAALKESIFPEKFDVIPVKHEYCHFTEITRDPEKITPGLKIHSAGIEHLYPERIMPYLPSIKRPVPAYSYYKISLLYNKKFLPTPGLIKLFFNSTLPYKQVETYADGSH